MKVELKPGVRIFAKDLKTGEVTEITDWLYFFEEEGIRDLSGEGHGASYTFWIETPDEANK
ncbi:MAG: hypothetical protein KME42_14140 [Tildeniella nuda ZEHNDER 1965/U140]|jgi:hypothetical protein|nr:hypothetical protein [Tildeniella nuda ZEHNDER 1965/U140]